MVASVIKGNVVAEFSRCVIINGSEKIPEDSQWVKIEVKRMFNLNLLGPGRDLETVLGFQMNSDDEAATIVRLRLGYFETYISSVIHQSIGEMSLGERSHISFEVDPRELDESTMNESAQNIFIDLKFDITLVDIENIDDEKYNRPIYKLDENDLMERSIEHKEEANQLFKLGRVRTAFRRYKKAIDYLIIAQQVVSDKEKALADNDIREQIRLVKSQIYSNLALCQLKSKAYDLAALNCTNCLTIDDRNVKALFRRAQARMCMKDYDDAIADYKQALSIEPGNQDVLTSLTNCERFRKDYERELASNLKKLFN